MYVGIPIRRLPQRSGLLALGLGGLRPWEKAEVPASPGIGPLLPWVGASKKQSYHRGAEQGEAPTSPRPQLGPEGDGVGVGVGGLPASRGPHR